MVPCIVTSCALGLCWQFEVHRDRMSLKKKLRNTSSVVLKICVGNDMSFSSSDRNFQNFLWLNLMCMEKLVEKTMGGQEAIPSKGLTNQLSKTILMQVK